MILIELSFSRTDLLRSFQYMKENLATAGVVHYLHGHKELIQSNSIRGYPYGAILARSTKDLVINSSNVLEGNGRAIDSNESGIDIWNVVSNRVTNGVVIQGNTVSNNSSSIAVPGRLPFAVRFSQHDCFGAGAIPVADCGSTTALSVINNVQVISNQFNNMITADYCVMNNVMAPNGWTLQAGWISCQ